MIILLGMNMYSCCNTFRQRKLLLQQQLLPLVNTITIVEKYYNFIFYIRADKKFLQIPIDYCLNWEVCQLNCFFLCIIHDSVHASSQMDKMKKIEDQLQAIIIRIIREKCSDCYNFNTCYLREGLFLCHPY